MKLNELVTTPPIATPDQEQDAIRPLLKNQDTRVILKCLLDQKTAAAPEVARIVGCCERFAREMLRSLVPSQLVAIVPHHSKGVGAPRKAFKAMPRLKVAIETAIADLNEARSQKLLEYFGFTPAFSQIKDASAPVASDEMRYFCQRYMHLVDPFVALIESGPEIPKRGQCVTAVVAALQQATRLSRPGIYAALGVEKVYQRGKIRKVLNQLVEKFGLLIYQKGKYWINPERRALIELSRRFLN